MKVIFTKYLPATANKPTRIKAYDQDRHSVTLSIDRALIGMNDDDRHRTACQTLCRKMEWKGSLQGGGLKNGDMVWTFLDAGLMTFDQAEAIDKRRSYHERRNARRKGN